MSAIQRPNAVEYTAQILNDLDEAMRKLIVDRRIINEATARANDLEALVNQKQRELLEEMKRMDLTSSGNYGFENRITRFLIDMRRAAITRSTAPVEGGGA